MGYKTAGFPHYGFNPLGFKQSGGIPNKAEALIWADRTTDGTQIDRIGRTTFDAVRPAYLVGGSGEYLEDILLSNIAFTYIDGNGASQSDTFDVNGKWIIDANGMSIIDFTMGTYAYHGLAQTVINDDGSYNDFVNCSTEDINAPTFQIQIFAFGATRAIYDDTLVSYLNRDGYALADGTQYIEEALTTLYPTGSRIPRILGTSKSVGWISGGNAPCDVGRVKYNVQIVDGVVDNGVDYENWNAIGYTDFTKTSEGVKITASATNGDLVISNVNSLIESTEYLFVFSLSKNDTSSGVRLAGSGDSVFFGMTTTLFDNNVGEQRILLTTNSSFTSTPTIEMKPIASFTGELDFSMEVYEASQFTNPLTDPLPTSQAFVEGNSFYLDEPYDLAVKADVNDYAYTDTDPTEVVSKLLECKDAVYGNYLFSSVTKGIVAMYETAQTGTNLVKIGKALDLNEIYMVSDGLGGFEPYIVDGEVMYVWKSTTYREDV